MHRSRSGGDREIAGESQSDPAVLSPGLADGGWMIGERVPKVHTPIVEIDVESNIAFFAHLTS